MIDDKKFAPLAAGCSRNHHRNTLMSEANTAQDRTIDVREIEPRFRHGILLGLFEHLQPGHGLQLIVDHDPRPLHYQLESRHGDRCLWSYLEQGPDVWRVRLELAAA
jgi:uncharacterized protein (DUF2249 family)